MLAMCTCVCVCVCVCVCHEQQEVNVVLGSLQFSLQFLLLCRYSGSLHLRLKCLTGVLPFLALPLLNKDKTRRHKNKTAKL